MHVELDVECFVRFAVCQLVLAILQIICPKLEIVITNHVVDYDFGAELHGASLLLSKESVNPVRHRPGSPSLEMCT